MLTENVTILRGPESEGYPFWDDVPAAISVLSIVAQNRPELKTDPETNE